MAEVTDIRQVRRKEKRRKRLWQLAGVLLLCAVIAVIACNWKAVSGFFTLPDPEHDLTRPVSSLPTEMGGTKLCQMLSDDESLLVLHDVSADRYEKHMKRYFRYPHNMSEPRAAMNGDWTILYAPGTAKATLFCGSRQALDLTTEDTVLQAAVSKEGHSAVATVSDLYSTALHVRSGEGKELFKLETAEQISALAFTERGKAIAAGSASTEKGALVSFIRQMQLNREKEDWTIRLAQEWVLSLTYDKAGNLTAICSDHAYLFSPEGKKLAEYAYPTELLQAAANGKRTILVFEAQNPADTRTVLLDNGFQPLCDVSVPGALRSCSLSGETAVVVTDKLVRVFGPEGKKAGDYHSDGSIRYAAWLDGRCIGVSDLHISELKKKA